MGSPPSSVIRGLATGGGREEEGPVGKRRAGYCSSFMDQLSGTAGQAAIMSSVRLKDDARLQINALWTRKEEEEERIRPWMREAEVFFQDLSGTNFPPCTNEVKI